jgi:hypothetical protein
MGPMTWLLSGGGTVEQKYPAVTWGRQSILQWRTVVEVVAVVAVVVVDVVEVEVERAA